MFFRLFLNYFHSKNTSCSPAWYQANQDLKIGQNPKDSPGSNKENEKRNYTYTSVDLASRGSESLCKLTTVKTAAPFSQ